MKLDTLIANKHTTHAGEIIVNFIKSIWKSSAVQTHFDFSIHATKKTSLRSSLNFTISTSASTFDGEFSDVIFSLISESTNNQKRAAELVDVKFKFRMFEHTRKKNKESAVLWNVNRVNAYIVLMRIEEMNVLILVVKSTTSQRQRERLPLIRGQK